MTDFVIPQQDSRAFRDVLGRFATGVTVVTCLGPDGQPLGLTVNSFNSVSLDPPLILWSLALSSPNLEAFSRCSHYAVNILAADQEALSNQFAGRSEDKFLNVRWQAGLGGVPLLDGCVASFEVFNENRIPGGDHQIFLGRVARCAQNPKRPPLLYFGGAYRQLA
ncbi:MAG: hypothetical protein RIR00_1838 [Pseudomonadota bacterium]|jgi:flavin reductase (DIM6/NTAB) family NADH-FMN oxidoreductase RutF